MAASANPSNNQDGTHGPSSFNGVLASNSNANSGGAVDSSGPAQALKHSSRLSVEWSAEEQSILEDGLNKYASEPTIVRYAKIAMLLQDKMVRDVAFRCRWMNKKEIGKRRKDENVRKNKEKKEKVTDPASKPSSQLTMRPNAPPYSIPMPIMDDDEISVKAIGGPTGQLLEQNAQVFNQISANLANMQIHENISLFCQTRDNILTILNDLNDMPGIMKQMPPLPVKVNEELANSILPRSSVPMQS